MTYASQQRRERILAEAYQKGHVTVKQLAAETGASEATIRRDLKALAEENQLELVHGGATVPRRSDYSFGSKSARQVEAKRIIGELAAGLVSDDDQIFLDSGTTCLAMAPLLRRKRSLFVIVNSWRLLSELQSAPGISLITVGGHYRSDRMDSVGPLATSALDQLRGYVAFIGADGLSMDFGPAASDIESAHLFRLAVRNAHEAILVVDHAKFLTPSLFKIVDWDAVSRVVTDKEPTPEWMQFLKEREIEVICPDADPSSEAQGERDGPQQTDAAEE